MLDVQERPLLIIEGDYEKLESQSLSCSWRFMNAAEGCGATPVLVRASTEADLHRQLANVLREAMYDNVVIIGHGNDRGVRLCRDAPLYTWDDLAEVLDSVEPLRMLLISCRSGQQGAVAGLFEAWESLREVFASPMNFKSNQTKTASLLMPFLTYRDEIGDGYARLMQVMGYLLDFSLVFRYTREQHERGNDISVRLLTAFEHRIVPFVAERLAEHLKRFADPNWSWEPDWWWRYLKSLQGHSDGGPLEPPPPGSKNDGLPFRAGRQLWGAGMSSPARPRDSALGTT